MIPDEVLTMVADYPFSCKHSGVFVLQQVSGARYSLCSISEKVGESIVAMRGRQTGLILLHLPTHFGLALELETVEKQH
jgi:hypothetical protein